jgi:hypothetical protein
VQTAERPSLSSIAVEVRVARLGNLGVKPVSQRLSSIQVAVTSTAAPGRRADDKRKNYDKADFFEDKMPNSATSIVTVESLSSL